MSTRCGSCEARWANCGSTPCCRGSCWEPCLPTAGCLRFSSSCRLCGHPIIMMQTLVAEVLVAYTLTGLTCVGLIRRGFVPVMVALVLGAPFWLPQSLWQGVILGPAAPADGLPRSFMTLAEMMRPLNDHTVGAMAAARHSAAGLHLARALSVRVWVPIVAGVAIAALRDGLSLRRRQTYPDTRAVAVRLEAGPAGRVPAVRRPVDGLEGDRTTRRAGRSLPLAGASLAGMMFLMLDLAPSHVKDLMRGVGERPHRCWSITIAATAYGACSNISPTTPTCRATARAFRHPARHLSRAARRRAEARHALPRRAARTGRPGRVQRRRRADPAGGVAIRT